MCCTNSVRRCLGLAVTAAAVLSCQSSNATNFLWNATVGSSVINWSNTTDWNPTGIVSIGDTAIFGVVGTVGDAQTVNNIVDTSTTVSGLFYTNAISGAWHVTQISAPNKLTVSSGSTFPTNFVVGGLNADGTVT